ncbi:T6 antigen [Roseburia hominis]|uniref:isopeptide-forming domain-containing fimbrial protein n=1 Tax=Catenibacterium mitsuokai TaxID=100886 RepID=UPI0006C0FAEB|nr:isopeptide-forming domain-containing fimbrial protein [Catenibacterium mitsuokai]CUO64507.1 T6 antigen [Catenibacterium mitsuokai]CUO89598.1 T6 antigen [Roseburia hominis]
MKLFKKLASFILAFAMVMAIAMPSVVMAADTTYNLTLQHTVEGHTYEVYQVFSGTLSTKDGKKVLSDLKWGSGVKTNAYSETAKTIAETLKDENAARAFAKELVDGNKLSNPTKTVESNATTTEITGLTAGYYLVKDTDGSLENKNDSYTAYILQVVGDATASVKSDVPSSEKKVKDINDSTETETTEWQDAADWDIGDEVPFKIEGKLPSNYDKYTKYTLKFHDKEEEGLTFKHESVHVYIDNDEILTGFEVVENPDDGDTFDVVFENLKNTSAKNNSVIRVEYKSVLNEQANLGKPGNKNTMYMEFSNNPNNEQGGEIGKTPEDTVIVFTYKVSVNKVNEKNEKLEGANFTLEKYVNGEWKLIDKVSGTPDDVFEFKGIDDGKYKLTEIQAPDNYDMLSDPIYFTVTADHVDGANPSLNTFSGNITSGNVGEMAFTANIDNGILSTTIQNKPGSSLPETGGMGTTVLYAAGTLMILAAAAFLVMKKKAESK